MPLLNPYGLLVGGLLLLIKVFFSNAHVLLTQIADNEIARKKNLDASLDYICQQLEQLSLVDVLPHDLKQREFIISRAMDVRSASMLFLAVNICHDSAPLGIPGCAALLLRDNSR